MSYFRVHADEDDLVMFYCPGCRCSHAVPTIPEEVEKGETPGPCWTWNGSKKTPTIRPSIVTTFKSGPRKDQTRCHLFVTAGKIKYLSDCTHRFTGQTVEMSDVDE